MESPGREEETYVLVEYAFEYTSKDGRFISIKPNERYMLLRRTNDHWWHVRKSKEARPFYIPAKYVKELGPRSQTTTLSENLPSVTLLENTNLEASTGTGRERLPEYEYQFVTAPPECEIDSSQCNSICSEVGKSDTGGKGLFPISGATRATRSTLSGSHGSLKPSHTRGPASPLVDYRLSAEHMRPTMSLDDLARFTPHGQKGTGNSGLYKTASWGHPLPLLKSHSENIHNPMEEDRMKLNTKEHYQPCESTDTDPVYVNLQELQLEPRTASASSAEATLQPPLRSSLTNWETHTDTESGHLYYYNPATGQTTWEPPFGTSANSASPAHSCSPSLAPSPSTPAEWDQYVDEASGHIFFYNTATGETSWHAPTTDEVLDYSEMQPAFSPYSPVDQRPPTPETDYPNFSPDEFEHYPEEDYSPIGSYQHQDYPHVPAAEQGWAPYGNQEGLVLESYHYASDLAIPASHHHSTSSGSSLESSPFGILSSSLLTFSDPKEEQFKTLEKAGMLYRTKTAEKGKRLRKNWSSSWTVLEGGVLSFFKDSKHSASGSVKHPSVLSSPEHTVDLHGATLSWASKDKSSKKNVLELKTREGSEYLIQHDSETIIGTWQKAIANSISRLVTDFRHDSNEENSADFRSKEQVGSSKEKEASWHSTSSLSSDCDANKVRNKLRKFLLRRPTLQALRERGYIKGILLGVKSPCSLKNCIGSLPLSS
ncbi:rho GTPase-activating protein 27 isoform X1 [Varanus komodoensis]|uniref:rho GTPase-activating protein 27 isoform X1 n=1 Tax=Varanus komodoensis TaxID=61221 RepID=UPI001CF789FE|nr:rho GTPase-activating protein 27 isoform X1 [Varanus komodoensis]